MKITKYFLSMAAALGMIAGCQKPEMIQIAAPEDVVAPVLEAVEGPIEITPDNMVGAKVTFTWSAADYGVATQVNYSLEAATAAAPEAKVSITSGLTKTTAEVDYETLNAILFNDLKLNDGVAEDVLFTVCAKVGEYTPVYSNAITVSCKVTAAEKQYAKLYVVGSYNGWSHDKNQYLFDFAATDAVYQGVVDFGEDHASNEFKITGGAWGKDEHSMSGPQDAEAKTITLVAGGGDNINVYQAKRYYHLTFDRALTLTADFSFDQLGVIGDFNGWGADVVMSFNETKQRFYADVEFPADGGFKFRADAGWDVNWGVKDGVLEAGADNIPVTAGNYRVYVNMNNLAEMTFELNAGMFGKDEPVGGTTTPDTPEPEPTPVVGWGLVGEYNGWGAEADVMLASDGTFLVAKGVALSGQVKFRKDADWAVNFGAPGEVEPVEIAVNTELELVANGKNFSIAEGTYDVYLDEANAKAWFINDGSYPGGGAAPEASEWGVVGVVNSWGGSPDVVMYKTATEGLFVAYKVEMPDGGFKIRANNKWDDTANYGLAAAGPVEVDHVYDLVCGGSSGDMTLAAGTYDIWFDLTNSKVYIMTPGKSISEAVGGEVVTPETPELSEITELYMLGGACDTGWSLDDMTAFQFDGTVWVWNGNLKPGNDNAFRFPLQKVSGQWWPCLVPNAEGTAVTYETTDVDNTYRVASEGYYKVTVDPATLAMTIERTGDRVETAITVNELYVLGSACDAGWSLDAMTAFENNGGIFTWTGNLKANEEFRFPLQRNWWPSLMISADGSELLYGMSDGDKVVYTVAETGVYTITIDVRDWNNRTYTIKSASAEPEQPEFEAVASEWGIVGDVNNWGNTAGVLDVVMYTTPTANLFVAKNVEMPAGSFKIRANNTWNDAANYGVENAGEVAVDHVYNVISSGGSGNMTLAAGTYDIWFDLNAKKVYIMTPGKDISAAVAGTPTAPLTDTWYLVGNFNGWKPADATYKMTSEGGWYVFKNFTADGKGVKFVADANWNVNRGGSFKANAAISLSQGGADMMVTAGTYDVYLSADAKTGYFMTPGTKPAN